MWFGKRCVVLEAWDVPKGHLGGGGSQSSVRHCVWHSPMGSANISSRGRLVRAQNSTAPTVPPMPMHTTVGVARLPSKGTPRNIPDSGQRKNHALNSAHKYNDTGTHIQIHISHTHTH